MIEPVGPGDDDHQPLHQRLAWFFGIAFASMLAVAAVAYALRAVLFIK
ncbi:MAG: DUF2474 family protein [Acidobacteria bacterium]|jgi:hypothetical protein|nr:DUF2474 family protein [Acidobacteriota bacterium]